jgi:hypothetical protein
MTPTGPNTTAAGGVNSATSNNSAPPTSGTTSNSGAATPGISDQTTHPAPVHPTDGGVKNANPR